MTARPWRKETGPLRNTLFQAVAQSYPTHLIGTNKLLAALWRVLFYLFRPTEPFVMRTALYRVRVHPRKGTLTRALIRRGYWEPTETRVFQNLLRPGMLVIDAGANFGHYALTAAAALGREGRVVAFEPDPATFKLLQDNVALLPADAAPVRAVQAGLSDRTGVLHLTHDDGNPGGHSFVAGNVWKAGCSLEVPVYTLDDWLAANLPGRAPDIIKIDVQGYEAKLLRGARATLETHRPIVFCEITADAMAAAGDSSDDLLTLFRDLGYQATVITGTACEAVDYDRLATLVKDPTVEYQDVLFHPAS